MLKIVVHLNMNNMLVTFVVVFATTNFLMVMSQERIIGGTIASIRDFPYLLSLHFRGFFLCGAVLITKSAALTGSHCVMQPSNMYYSIRAGSELTNFGGISVHVARIVKHPKYNSENYDNDIAVLILNYPVNLYNQIIPIKLPQPNENPRSGQTAVVSGWGSRNYSYGYYKSILLRKVNVMIIDQNVCKRNYSPNVVTDRMICAGNIQGGKDTCQGDSGGPLVSHGKLVGIVSWGIGCGLPTYPGVYTRIPDPQIRSFIKQYAGI